MSRTVSLGMILQQPWARLVAEGVFPVLVRSVPTNTRGVVGVIASGMDVNAVVDGRRPDEREFPQPALVGYVRITGCTEVPSRDVQRLLRRRYGKRFASFYPGHYLPRTGTAYLWTLEKPRFLKRPKKLSPPRTRVWKRL